jgi:hypothetical protein
MLRQTFSSRQRLIFGQCCQKSTAGTWVDNADPGRPGQHHSFADVSSSWAQLQSVGPSTSSASAGPDAGGPIERFEPRRTTLPVV